MPRSSGGTHRDTTASPWGRDGSGRMEGAGRGLPSFVDDGQFRPKPPPSAPPPPSPFNRFATAGMATATAPHPLVTAAAAAL